MFNFRGSFYADVGNKEGEIFFFFVKRVYLHALLRDVLILS